MSWYNKNKCSIDDLPDGVQERINDHMKLSGSRIGDTISISFTPLFGTLDPRLLVSVKLTILQDDRVSIEGETIREWFNRARVCDMAQLSFNSKMRDAFFTKKGRLRKKFKYGLE